MTSAIAQLPDFSEIEEPALIFNPYELTHRDQNPLRGLATFGPFSSNILGAMPAAIRLAAIVPAGTTNRVTSLITGLQKTHEPKERRAYLPTFPGFEQVFGQRLELDKTNIVELPATLGQEITTGPNPHHLLAEEISNSFGLLRHRRADWDIVLIYLPDAWQVAFEGGASDDFDLHDFIKAKTAAQAIPTQIFNNDVFTYTCRASVGWRLGVALYVKAGGVPWKMEPLAPDTIFIGLSYALRRAGDDNKFVTCCSQIFDAEGTGLEFLAYETEASKVSVFGRSPFLNREQMRLVLGRSLALYLDRHPGQMPKRVVIHKTTEFKGQEIDGAFDALARVDDIELLQIQDTDWRGVRLVAPAGGRGVARPDGYPLARGTTLYLGEREMLVWVQGNSSSVTGGKSWYPVGKSIPRPLLIRRFAGSGEGQLLAAEILALTKMNWNNDNLNDGLPATLGFAHRLAEVVKRMPRLDPKPYPLRLFM
jgi:hypothetical protein